MVERERSLRNCFALTEAGISTGDGGLCKVLLVGKSGSFFSSFHELNGSLGETCFSVCAVFTHRISSLAGGALLEVLDERDSSLGSGFLEETVERDSSRLTLVDREDVSRSVCTKDRAGRGTDSECRVAEKKSSFSLSQELAGLVDFLGLRFFSSTTTGMLGVVIVLAPPAVLLLECRRAGSVCDVRTDRLVSTVDPFESADEERKNGESVAAPPKTSIGFDMLLPDRLSE